MTRALAQIREDAEHCFLTSVEAANPIRLIRDFFAAHPNISSAKGHLAVVAIGKAAGKMMTACLDQISNKTGLIALVVTNRENQFNRDGVETIYGGHPLPDHGSFLAGRRIFQLAESLGVDDRLLLLLSGGGSALQICPPNGVSWEDKIALNRMLLPSGANINEINTVRRSISLLKGGGLAKVARPASVVSLILSDVPYDNIEFVASGPTVCPTKSELRPIEVLQKYGLWDGLRDSLRAKLVEMANSPEADQEGFDHVENFLIGCNSVSVEAAISVAQASYHVLKPCQWLDGEVGMAASFLWNAAKRISEDVSEKQVALICGGEPTVKVIGRGKGGRNQELALRFALKNQNNPLPGKWVFLSAGTDGRDGPTDAAGAMVDVTTLERLTTTGIDPVELLKDNDSYHALQPIDDLIVTGDTGTNVGDIQLFLHVR